MGSLNPVLLLFAVGVIVTLDALAFVASLPFGLAAYLYLKRDSNS
jgi:hypothetical protein